MSKKTRRAAFSVLAGSMLFGGGCLSLGGFFNPRRLATELFFQAAGEFVIDNNAVFDLFPDGGAAATTTPTTGA